MDRYDTTKQRWLHWLVSLCVRDLRQTWLRWNRFDSNYDLHVTPALTVMPWRESCLATMPELGITTHSVGVGLELWRWHWTLTFGVSTQPDEDRAAMLARRDGRIPPF